MPLNPPTFSQPIVVDTCSVWHVLSSIKLYKATRAAKVVLIVTSMVIYECLYKRRKLTPEIQELMTRLTDAQKIGAFPTVACEIEDLAAVGNLLPRGLSSGEVSCMAHAYRVGLAVMTDDQKARRSAENILSLKVETTPKLYGWLHYHLHLVDSDHRDVLTEHEKFEPRPLSSFFQQTYEAALMCRLDQAQQAQQQQ